MTEIIVEIGLNHLGSQERAQSLLETVCESSADALTFQIREPSFYENAAPARRRLSLEFYRQAAAAAHRKGKRFGIAIADQSSISAFDEIGVDFWKTLSWDFKNRALQDALQATGKPVLMSTGLSGMEEIVEGSKLGGNTVLIHTQLSQKVEEVNLKAIAEIRKRTGLPVAFGLHCHDHEVLKTALGFEPCALLFYIKEAQHPDLFDDEHAIAAPDLARLTAELKRLMAAIGDGNKAGAEKPSWVVH